ncbi:aldehyde dehydrogenase family protein [Amycolatopsis jiangsuensis]|uniref:Aldehyde dehydrogenase (NAD+) n=1 Tax=Amycolatopsis jiangsuensis TaxID=1181879 RepID=A0A840INF7_9PSEU|nr:aldehyde dehydrogenase family protein [Amycolatopsis jiangsuensis]MBB4683896.1 aldehyde dehydrogenase (NAD+) [Amycolatopsis jiangsuensis]
MTQPAAQEPPAFVPPGRYRMYVDGEWVAGETEYDAVNPSTGLPWTRLPLAAPAHVAHAVRAAGRAFRDWRRSSPATRQQVLAKIADRIEADPGRWAQLLATENGRPIREATVADVPSSAAIFRYFSGLARDHHGDQLPVEDPHTLVYTTREPLGVIAAVLPWNSPIITLANKVAPALAAGNTVVVKPSEFATASVLEFAALVADLLPPGVFNVVTGDGRVGAALVAHPDVAKVTLTGGGPTARRIMAAAAEALTPTIMELGGKSALIVAEDADLERAVADAALGIYLANGEACIASSRILLHDAIADELLERFAGTARSIRVGDALDPETQVGPLVSRQQHDRVRAHLDSARRQGLRLCAGDEPLDLPASRSGGFYLRPAILYGDRVTAEVASEEVFGPATVAERFTDYADAVERANSTRYGLASGVWTNDLTRAHRIARDLDAGIVWVNKWFDLPAGVPMGGIKDSGFGRELCRETMLEFSAPKVVNIDLGAPRLPLWG